MKPTGRGSGPERGGLSREKRPLEKDGTSDGTEEEKRQRLPALASVILEAVKMDSLQKLCSQLEPVLRRVVGEEVERALAKFVPAKLGTSARSTMSGTYMREHIEKANWQVYESKSIVHRLPRVLIWELNTTSIYSFLHLIWSAASADRSHHYSELFELDLSEYSGLSDAGIQDMPLNEHVSALWELLFLFFQTAICFWQ